MRAGDLRHSLTLQTPVRTADGGGGYAESWTTVVAGLRAMIAPASASQIERLFSGAVEATVSHLVTIRYYPGITTQMRLLFGARIFRICGLRNVDERNIQMELACQEIVS